MSDRTATADARGSRRSAREAEVDVVADREDPIELGRVELECRLDLEATIAADDVLVTRREVRVDLRAGR